MKYAIVYRDDNRSRELTEHFHELADTHELIHDEKKPDIVLSIGGDGTMLQAFHKYIERLDQISFVGIHTGRLGFFADWKPDKIEEVASLMYHSSEKDHGLRVVEYPVVEVEITTAQGVEKRYALNEITFKSMFITLVAQLSINDEPFETFRGDGICISSPSGSTAYNKSLGGAIVHPAIEAIQITEIASINNRVFRTLGSPIILPKHHHIDIVPKSQQGFILTVDHQAMQLHDVKSIRCRVSPDKKVKFARFRPFPFWMRVREAFIGTEF
ncbi:NAD kinase [Paenibacillus albiflavus]|uniref:NAD kinase n=1 Tax=Paenibacillus albiflavus TaxID=2545760 RepID=A0A4R4E7Y8_9BACL|nr:NAD kinase [Paenibacillus albiflavus]TCZ75876.1 NAD kinase [Paenibacillus albiflavus]